MFPSYDILILTLIDLGVIQIRLKRHWIFWEFLVGHTDYLHIYDHDTKLHQLRSMRCCKHCCLRCKLVLGDRTKVNIVESRLYLSRIHKILLILYWMTEIVFCFSNRNCLWPILIARITKVAYHHITRRFYNGKVGQILTWGGGGIWKNMYC